MKLYKQKVSKTVADGRTATFVDFYVGWVYDGKSYVVRVRPCFGEDFGKLYAVAHEVSPDEPVEKFL